MPVYKNTTNKHIAHIDKYSGSKWNFSPGEEKVLDFYLDEPLEDGIVIINEEPYPNPIRKFEEFSGNQGETLEMELSGEDANYYGEYEISVKVDSGSLNLAFNNTGVLVKTKVAKGEVWAGRVHKKYVKKVIFEFLEDGTSGKIEFFRSE